MDQRTPGDPGADAGLPETLLHQVLGATGPEAVAVPVDEEEGGGEWRSFGKRSRPVWR